jgi:hypothetical protein
MNDEAEKIRKFFESIDCKPLIILETPKAGEIVDNGYGVEFDLPKYAVIHANEIRLKKSNYSRLLDFEKKENISLSEFNSSRCASIEDFINELSSMDSYKVIWRQE